MKSTARVLLSVKIKSYPALFRPIALLREDGKKSVVRRDTDVVIEGYWRCGNHFAVYALDSSQARPVKIAHHFHAPAQLMLAVRWGIPALLLIREPVEAVASATVYLHKHDPGGFLRFYCWFHEALVDWADKLVVSDFPTTVGRFDAVIAAINARYGRAFEPFAGTPEACAKVEAMIRQEHEQNMGANERQLPLPSQEKGELKRQVIERMHSPEYDRLLTEARRLYELFAARAVKPQHAVVHDNPAAKA